MWFCGSSSVGESLFKLGAQLRIQNIHVQGEKMYYEHSEKGRLREKWE